MANKVESSYLNLNKKPSKDDIVVTFKMNPQKGFDFIKTAQELAAESSVGTWTEITTLTKGIFQKLAAKIVYLDKEKSVVKIAYPIQLFEKGNIAQLLSTISGNIFSLKKIKILRLEDVEFSPRYINSFLGPQIGLQGIRKLYKIHRRSIIGCIIKPKVGLSPEKTAKLAYEIFSNGVDLIKDDETLTDMSFCRFEKRVREMVKAINSVEKKSKSRKIFVFNVTAPADEMIKRAALVKKLGGRCVMVDIITSGFSALQYLRNQNFGLIIHGHRAGHSAFTRNKDWGISMLVVAKIARLAGIDELHTGTVVGKMEGDREEVVSINNFLRSKFGKLKPVLPVASGGLHPGLVEKLVKILGKDLVINFGGGLHGHPLGSAAGARAVYQAIDAVTKGIPLNRYAQTYQELKLALEHWGYEKK
ncbi:type III ribulose-bisphosphate carboxylase [bacterium]|nr:type III ribulose-bisphosphate carboxylase [bacterium]